MHVAWDDTAGPTPCPQETRSTSTKLTVRAVHHAVNMKTFLDKRMLIDSYGKYGRADSRPRKDQAIVRPARLATNANTSGTGDGSLGRRIVHTISIKSRHGLPIWASSS